MAFGLNFKDVMFTQVLLTKHNSSPKMTSVNTPLSEKVALYLSLFHEVHHKRLRYVNRVILLTSCVLAIVWKLPFKESRSDVLSLLYQVPLLCAALILIKLCRNKNTVVEYLRAKTLMEQISQSVISRQFITTSAYFGASALIFFATYLSQLSLFSQYYVLSKEFRKRPAVNDLWVYYWFHALVCAIVYATQQIVFQRNRLRFTYGISTVKPRSVIFSTLPQILGNSVFFTLFVSLISPFLYFWARPLIYNLTSILFALASLDTSMPPYHIALKDLLSMSFASFLIFLVWEFINHVYETYATIGCLDGKTTISSKSSVPIQSLLQGLRDVSVSNQLVRLTAFQELAYIASTASSECSALRKPIFSSSDSALALWSAIFDECSLVINEVALRINYRTKADLDALKNLSFSSNDDSSSSLKKDSLIFGNSSVILTPHKSPEMAKQNTQDPSTAESINAPSRSLYFGTTQFIASLKNHLYYFIYANPSDPQKVLKTEAIHKWLAAQRHRILSSYLGAIFRISFKRDAELRIINPVNFGNAIIALSGILLHAVEEDRYETISDHQMSEVFNLLERPIRSCMNYIEVVPASVYITEAQRKSSEAKSHLLVAILHDMAMREFINLCIKYNYKLNDLLLSTKAYKLAKWVIDASIAQQLQQKQEQMAQVL